jgi:hypothetical protein
MSITSFHGRKAGDRSLRISARYVAHVTWGEVIALSIEGFDLVKQRLRRAIEIDQQEEV